MNKFMKDFNGEKVFSLEYDKETLKDMVLDKQEEIERLNNIIIKLEKYIEEQINLTDTTDDQDYVCNVYSFVYSKLKELKGSDKE